MSVEHETLTKISFLANLPSSSLERLSMIARTIEMKEGDVIFNEGEPGDGAYILLEGEVTVQKRAQGKETPEILAVLQENAIFGEMSLFDDRHRCAEIVTRKKGRLIKIPKKELLEEFEKGDSFALRLLSQVTRVLSDRLSKLDDQLLQLMEDSGGQTQEKLADFARFKEKVFSEWSF